MLSAELRRLRKAGLADLSLRPHRYPALTEKFAAGGVVPADTVSRLAYNQRVFQALLDELPTPAMRTAASVLFHVGSGSTPPPLDDRRRAADRAYTGRSYAREPDTVQRHLERAVLDPLLLHALEHLSPPDPRTPDTPPVLDPSELESWADDLDRAHIYLNRQDFRTTAIMLQRWLTPYAPASLDDRGLYLRGRSLMLLGDMRRYQGMLVGPLSAQQAYQEASSLFTQLDIPRRLAQIELSVAIGVEMYGDLQTSASMYRQLATDERLRDYERARARLWIGTSLTKSGDIEPAMREIDAASHAFEDLGEPDGWGIAHQKRALAQLAAGDLRNATRSIDLAASHRREDSPFEQVRLGTARGHVLVMDRRTADEGLRVLTHARDVATKHGLNHQLQWVEKIQGIPEQRDRRPQ
ncbi:MAG: hypothetical protein GEV07_05335 [Streptosporangiales bacterium]|nr:hypothetical protein [Streptosporangiales bacterium]